MLSIKVPDLSEIEVLGSSCTLYQDVRNEVTLSARKPRPVSGKNDEHEEYRVYIPGDKVVVVTTGQDLLKPPQRSKTISFDMCTSLMKLSAIV